MDILSQLRRRQLLPNAAQETQQLRWQVLAEGVLQFSPKSNAKLNPAKPNPAAVVLSAGIHGNETAPIEVLAHLCDELLAGRLQLSLDLLVIFGNPAAIARQVRYVADDVNRLFLGRHADLPANDETRRTEVLEQQVAVFYQHCFGKKRYHYDLHTAIRPSLMPTFALLPKPVFGAAASDMAFDETLLQSLYSCDLDAIAYHTQSAHTFTSFSASLGAASVTLELGKVLPFGENRPAEFLPTQHMLAALISGHALPARCKPAPAHFLISDILIKKSDAFALLLDPNTPNFSPIEANQVIATDGDSVYRLPVLSYALFLNAGVKVGLRAGLFMSKLSGVPRYATLIAHAQPIQA